MLFFDDNLAKCDGSDELLKDAGNKIAKAMNEVISGCTTVPSGLELSLAKVITYGMDAAAPDLGQIFLQGCNTVEWDVSEKTAFDELTKEFKKFLKEKFLCTEVKVVKNTTSMYQEESAVTSLSIRFSNEQNYFENEDFDQDLPSIVGCLNFNIVQMYNTFAMVSVSCVINTDAA